MKPFVRPLDSWLAAAKQRSRKRRANWLQAIRQFLSCSLSGQIPVVSSTFYELIKHRGD